ncbi:Hypothetical protein A7982_10459 [Minicystis rosea]|nr:Hypothetical protein A7982_10459 [Minicystis rosea]
MGRVLEDSLERGFICGREYRGTRRSRRLAVRPDPHGTDPDVEHVRRDAPRASLSRFASVKEDLSGTKALFDITVRADASP